MPKNKFGGKKHKKGKNSTAPVTRQMQYAIDKTEVYGVAKKMLGDCRILALCSDGGEHVCHIRGKMRKKIWINLGDVVLISMRGSLSDTQDDKGDVIYKYNAEEIRRLQKERLLANILTGGDTAAPAEENILFESEEDDDDNGGKKTVVPEQPDRMGGLNLDVWKDSDTDSESDSEGDSKAESSSDMSVKKRVTIAEENKHVMVNGRRDYLADIEIAEDISLDDL